MADDRRGRDAPYVVQSHRKPGDGRFVLLGEKVPHDGRCLVTDLFELCNHRIHPALVSLSRLSENSGNVVVFEVIGTITWGESVNLIKVELSHVLALDGLSLAIFGVVLCCQQTPGLRLELLEVRPYTRELSNRAF